MTFDHSAYHRQYYLENKEKIKQRSLDHYKANKEEILERQKARKSHRAKLARERRKRNPDHIQTQEAASKYGISYEQAKELRSVTHCQICGVELGRGKNQFAIDHCHETGQVRGVLCGLCNKGLGMFRDDPSLLQSAIVYLDKPKLFQG